MHWGVLVQTSQLAEFREFVQQKLPPGSEKLEDKSMAASSSTGKASC